jgi:hypothetical protein
VFYSRHYELYDVTILNINQPHYIYGAFSSLIFNTKVRSVLPDGSGTGKDTHLDNDLYLDLKRT